MDGLTYWNRAVCSPSHFVRHQSVSERLRTLRCRCVQDPEATLAIFGTEIDWVETATEKKFVFLNPNEKARCGCGESFCV